MLLRHKLIQLNKRLNQFSEITHNLGSSVNYHIFVVLQGCDSIVDCVDNCEYIVIDAVDNIVDFLELGLDSVH